MRRGLLLALVGGVVACASTPRPSSPVPLDRRAGASSPLAAPPSVPAGFLGGLREIEIDAPPSVVMEVLCDPEAYRTTLPFVQSLEVVGRGPRGEALVTIVQGTSLVHGRYTAHLLCERADRVRIWLDGDAPHDIDAADGFAEVRPREGGGSRLTWFLAFDLGGAIRFLFGAKIQRAAMSTPERIRAMAEERARPRLSDR